MSLIYPQGKKQRNLEYRITEHMHADSCSSMLIFNYAIVLVTVMRCSIFCQLILKVKRKITACVPLAGSCKCLELFGNSVQLRSRNKFMPCESQVQSSVSPLVIFVVSSSSSNFLHLFKFLVQNDSSASTRYVSALHFKGELSIQSCKR